MAFSNRLLLGAGAVRLLVVTLELTPILVAGASEVILRCVSSSALLKLATPSQFERAATRGTRELGCEEGAVASAKDIRTASATLLSSSSVGVLRLDVTVSFAAPMSKGMGRLLREGPLGEEPAPVVLDRGVGCMVPEPAVPWNACLSEELLELLDRARARGRGCMTLILDPELT